MRIEIEGMLAVLTTFGMWAVQPVTAAKQARLISVKAGDSGDAAEVAFESN